MKPIHSDCPLMVKAVRRQLALSQEDLVRELGVSFATSTGLCQSVWVCGKEANHYILPV